jgi:hypothetical protein
MRPDPGFRGSGMSIVRDGFKSIYRSGAGFTAVTLPKYLQKAGLSKSASARISKVAGNAAGIASVIIGAQFLVAIPLSVPMFFVAATVMHVKGMLMAAAVAGLLTGTGAIVMTTGLGMCRDAGKAMCGLFKSAQTHTKKPAPVPSVPVERSSFTAKATPAADFEIAVIGNEVKTAPAASTARPHPAP